MRYPKLPELSSRYGAPMGRQDIRADPASAIRFRLYRMPMVDGGYDTGGAYWGAGDRTIGWVYHAYGADDGGPCECFVRARTRDEAKSLIREEYPRAKFYR